MGVAFRPLRTVDVNISKDILSNGTSLPEPCNFGIPFHLWVRHHNHAYE